MRWTLLVTASVLWTAGLCAQDAAGGAALDASVAEDAGSGSGPHLDVIARLEPAQVQLGERFELVVEVQRSPEQRIEVPARVQNDQVSQLGEVQRQVRQDGERVTETLRVPLAAFALKNVETPALPLRLGDGEIVEVAPLPVTVQTALGDDAAAQGLAEAKGPVELTRFDPRPVAVLGGIVLLGLLGVGLWWWRRRRKRRGVAAPKAEPPRPAHEVALECLDALERSPWVQQGELQRFVDEAIAILRTYLGARYGIAALDMTSTELLTALETILDARLDVDEVRQILGATDLVKFARAPTTTRACAALVDKIRRLVRVTTPRRQGVAA
ncbi:MAG: hypothetical protein ABIJ09_10685 [Pseudomonadota bacterium]